MNIKLPIYLDYMATTPLDSRVNEVMQRCLRQDGNFGNPASTTHVYGWRAKEAVDVARDQVAACINSQANEIIFTSGATEANNLAIIGAANFYSRKGKHIITVKTEHKAVLDVCRHLESNGFSVTTLSTDAKGILQPEVLAAAIRDDTILVSIMHVNNEIGVIQDIASLTKLTRHRGIIFHCDASQSIGKVKVDVEKLDIDLLSLSAHKAYGPKGAGALYIRRNPRVRLTPLFYGGGHEQGLRSGTLATHQIVGMGEAFEIANRELVSDVKRISELRDKFWSEISQIDQVVLNGHETNRVVQNINVGFGYVDGDALLLALKDLAVSTGSACTSASIEPSHVLLAIGVPSALAHSSIRFSFGRFTTIDEVNYAVQHIKKQVSWLRNMSPLWEQYEKESRK